MLRYFHLTTTNIRTVCLLAVNCSSVSLNSTVLFRQISLLPLKFSSSLVPLGPLFKNTQLFSTTVVSLSSNLSRTSTHVSSSVQEVNMADARYCVEYAKTGRSSCKKCKSQIEKGVSRIGKITTNPFSDDGGEMKVWYHTRCMFETLKVSESM